VLDRLLHPREQRDILTAIRAAELRTSSELKVHVEARCPAPDPYTRAVMLFEKLGLHRTVERNGVLIYVAIHDRRFTIIGDSGIGEPPGTEFWAEPMRPLSIALRRAAPGEGIVAAIRVLGERLAKRFPAQPGNPDEIDNEISTEDTGGSP
jgi:uncharacterized membrane protein